MGVGTVVTKETETYGVYGGVPAKRIKDRYETEVDMRKHISILDNLREKDVINYRLKNKKYNDKR